MRNFFVFDGVSTVDCSTFVSGGGTFETPERDFETIEIAGRSGNLIIDNGRFKNITVKYPLVVMKDFRQNKEALVSKLASRIGYKVLTDTFDESIYRLACFKGVSGMKIDNFLRAGVYSIEFDCKPQSFLKSGDYFLDVQTSTELFNPTDYDALPIIEITGTGLFSINDQQFRLKASTGAVIVDSENREVYEGNTNRNKDFERLTGDLPVIESGRNVITLPSGMSLKIKPRWYTIK